MSFTDQLKTGIKSYLKAIDIIFNNGLWIYFIFPLIIYLLLMTGGFALVKHLTAAFENFAFQFFDSDNQNYFLKITKGVLHFFISIGLNIVFFFIGSMINKYIVLILMSPVMALLSQKTETILTGKQFPFNSNQFLKDIGRGILICLRNLFLQAIILLLSFVLVCIPVIGWLVPLVLCLISWYFYGFAMMDYMSERRKLNVTQSVKYMRKHKGIAISNGFIFSVIFAIPFVGVIFASVISPVAASIAVLESEK